MPYLATAIFAAPLVSDPHGGTISIDRRWRVRVDPDVAAGLSVAELGRLLLHLYGHAIRDAGGWARWAETVLPSRVDWRRVLAAELRNAVAAVAGQVDYSYRRPARRAHLDRRVVMPTLVRPVPEVAIVCDTSGSMHERLLTRALSEIDGVLTRAGLRARKVPVLAVDAAVQAVVRTGRARDVALAGGGGTDMGQGIAAAATLRPHPTVVIVLTDGYTPWPDTPPPGIRVIVGLLADGHPTWSPPEWARTIIIIDDDLSPPGAPCS